MQEPDLRYLCTIIGNLTGVPIRVYEKEEQIFYASIAWLPKDPMSVYRDAIWRMRGNVGYVATNHFHYYGIVNSGNLKIIVGPTRQTAESDQELRELAFRADVAPEDVEAFVTGMKQIVRMPLESIMQMLCAINYMLRETGTYGYHHLRHRAGRTEEAYGTAAGGQKAVSPAVGGI